MKREELSQSLFKNINLVEPYPNLVASVDVMIDVTAFFPGGKGLWNEEESEVFPSILSFRSRRWNRKRVYKNAEK